MRLESIFRPAINDGTQDGPFLAIGAMDFPTEPGCCHNIGRPSETHSKLNYYETAFLINLYFSIPIILKLFTEHGSDTAVLWAKFQKNLTVEMIVICK